jgi:hypothetical protein
MHLPYMQLNILVFQASLKEHKNKNCFYDASCSLQTSDTYTWSNTHEELKVVNRSYTRATLICEPTTAQFTKFDTSYKLCFY